MKPFRDLQPAGQVDRITPSAWHAVRLFGISAARVRMINHGFNTTFEVRDQQGRRFALRMNFGWLRNESQIRGEVAWTNALARETDLAVLRYQARPDGEYLVPVRPRGFDRDIWCVLSHWLPGADVGDDVTPQVCRAMGRAMATMHAHARTFQIPDEASFDGYTDLLAGQTWRLDGHEFTDVFKEVHRQAQAVLDDINRQEKFPIHFDMHFWNVKFRKGRLAVFDFDDAVCAPAALDPVQMLYYVRTGHDDERLEAAMWEGLGAVDATPEQIEILIGGRNVLLANDVVGQANAELQAIAPKYLERSGRRLARLLETGRFRKA
jgi:Ser/Thr protein kinase RdoA (MazF antagonist)